MGDISGFMKYDRQDPFKEHVKKRVNHYREFVYPLPMNDAKTQGARCMDCGVPFCTSGCPLGNHIPEWNELLSDGHWREALDRLLSTNNFPEFTGRVCPAPCESACVLGINEKPVAIEAIEMALVDRGFAEGWIQPKPPKERSGFSVAVVGSGPAGLAAAEELNKMGHRVTVFERSERPGGLLMFGIPDFKLEKTRVERRIDLMEKEGIIFRTGVNVGKEVTTEQLKEEFHAVLLACGANEPRNIAIEGRDLKGVYFASEFLNGQTRSLLAKEPNPSIYAKDKDVIIIGGGDTGADCVGTSNRHGAKSITQFEILETPPAIGKFPAASKRPQATPWPMWTHMLRESSSHEEGCERYWTLNTKKFVGDKLGNLVGLVTEKVEWHQGKDGKPISNTVLGSEKYWSCDLAFIAVGFTGPEKEGPISDLGLELDKRGNVSAPRDYKTSQPGVFAAGDMRRGQSLVVWAIKEGREAAVAVDNFLVSGATRRSVAH